MLRVTGRGTIDFRHDATSDVVIQTPRWTLDSPVEVMRWYQMQAGYFGGRFREPKDVIVVNDAFDVTPQVATLWGQYRARLHESYIRFSVRVRSNARVLLTTNTSAVRYSISAVECASVEEAVAAIRGARERASESKAISGARPRQTASFPAAASSRPPKASES